MGKKNIDEEPEYTVEEIRAKKITGGKTFYLVKWKGYKDSENTWEPKENVSHLKALLKKFEDSHTVPTDSKNSKTTSNLQKNSRKIKKDTAVSKGRSASKPAIKKSSTQVSAKAKPAKKIAKKAAAANATTTERKKNYGSFSSDEPSIISGHKTNPNKKLAFRVEWKKRKNGETPKSTWEYAPDLKEHCPRLLVDYYEKFANLK